MDKWRILRGVVWIRVSEELELGLANIIYCYFAASHLTSSLSLFGCQMELRRLASRIVFEQPEEADERQILRSL